jgi:hypothetical protein
MKNKILKSFLIISILIISSFSVQGQIKKAFRGTWDFNAPTAPPGFEVGIMTITRDSVFTKYPGDHRVLPSSSLTFKNNTLTFKFNPAVEVTITVSLENKTKLTGKATWLSDESIITLTKIQPTESKKQKNK